MAEEHEGQAFHERLLAEEDLRERFRADAEGCVRTEGKLDVDEARKAKLSLVAWAEMSDDEHLAQLQTSGRALWF